MANDVILGSALRSNLLSLSNTNSLIDRTQIRLATGLAVGSALDNPQNFFAAQSLNNRAGDLSSLLDSIGQSIRVIEEADTGITSLTSLVNQADSIAQQARESLAAIEASASVTGSASVSLANVADLTSLAGINDGDSFVVQVGSAASSTVTINTGDSTSALLADINAIDNVEASIDASGQLSIRSTNGEDLRIANGTNLVSGAASTALTSANGLGFTTVAAAAGDATVGTLVGTGLATGDNIDADTPASTGDSIDITVGSGTTAVTTTITVGAADTVGDLITNINNIEGVEAGLTDDGRFFIRSSGSEQVVAANNAGALLTDFGLLATNTLTPGVNGTTFTVGSSITSTFTNATTGNPAARTDQFADLLDFTGLGAGDTLDITVNGGTTVNISLDASISDVVDDINNNANGNTSSNLAGLTATFDESTGLFTINVADTVSNFDVGTTLSAGTDQTAFGFGNGVIDTVGGVADQRFESSNGDADETLAQLADDFNEVRTQIDGLVADASFAGVNLLNGDDLITIFNETGTSQLTSQGVTFTSQGLGIEAASFTDFASISLAESQVSEALESVRSFGNTIANDLSIIQTRQDFTQNTINTLVSGAEDLTVADQTEEGANLLALQTRQQLGVTSLALAAQSQQAVLSLF